MKQIIENMKGMRLLKIWEILKDETDEEHPMSTAQIIGNLSEVGIECDRRTLYRDIKVLNDYNHEVLQKRSVSNEYYVMDRIFSIPELRILMDAVQSASFITEKKTQELFDKISVLCGNNHAELLKRDHIAFNVTKHTNESIYYNIEEIDEGIHSNRKISFLYASFNEHGEKELRNDGSEYKISPLATVFNNGNYYVFGYYEKYNDICSFRIDRMSKVKATTESNADNQKVRQFDLERRRNEMFDMYSGDETEVTIAFDADLTDVILDRFGESTKITVFKDNKFTTTVLVRKSPIFFGWCCSFGGRLKIISPKYVQKQLSEYLELLSKQYNT